MNSDHTTEFFNSLQKAQAAPAGAAPAKAAGPSKELVTKIAVKFVNAMWFTLFHKVFALGM